MTKSLLIWIAICLGMFVTARATDGLRMSYSIWAAMALAVIVMWAARRKILCWSLAIVGVTTFNLSSQVAILGDGSWIQLASSDERTIWSSSAGAHFVLRMIVSLNLDPSFVSPTCGVLTTVLLVWHSMRRSKILEVRWNLGIAIMVGTLPIFARGFIEVTPIGFPLAVGSLLLALNIRNGSGQNWMYWTSLVTAGAAAFTHGVYLLAAFLVVVRTRSSGSVASRLKVACLNCLVVALTVALLVTGIRAMSFQFVAGDAFGGGDDRVLPPSFFRIDHLNQTLMLGLVGSFLASNFISQLPDRRVTIDDLLTFGISSMFLLCWNFDLGWSRDLDLVWASSVIFLWPRSITDTPRDLSNLQLGTIVRLGMCLLAYSSVASTAGWQLTL